MEPDVKESMPSALDDATIAILQDPATLGEEITVVRPYKPVKYVAHGRKGVVWQVEDPYGQLQAAKFTLLDPGDRDAARREFLNRQSLPAPLFTRISDIGEWTAPNGQAFSVTVEEWVPDSITLGEFLRSEAQISVRTILGFVEQMARAFDALESKDLAHDDLHSNNILIRPSQAGEASYSRTERSYQAVVVDTGSLKKAETIRKPWDDVTYLASHLVRMHNVVHHQRDLSMSDRRFLREMRALTRLMVDDDATRALRHGDDIVARFNDAYTRAQRGTEIDSRSMSNPFEFISAEQIGSDELLLRLFAHTSWLGAVTSNDPVLITGPRGCGKSMVLRWLSLRAHASRSSTEVPIDELGVSGIYVSCTSDFQNRFAEFQDEASVEARRLEIIHYFNLIHLRELIATLLAIADRPDRETVFGFGAKQAADIGGYVHRFLEPSSIAVFSNNPLRGSLETVDAEIFASQMRLHSGAVPFRPTPLTFLGDFTEFLSRAVPFFASHRVAFLLDDFSTHRLSAAVQRVLLPIVWERRASHLFKVSSEKYGIVDDYQGGELTVDLARERIEIDCGAEFLEPANRIRNRDFARELLVNRLTTAGWVGTPEQLIGSSPSSNQLAEELVEAGSRSAYYGMETIANLCSGDVSTLLLVYRKVLANSNEHSTDQVSNAFQHLAITDVSRQLLRSVTHHRPRGRDMHRIASFFGEWVGQMLRGDARVRERGEDVPIQIPRIEVDDASGTSASLSEDEQAFSRELIRRAVFIELEIGRSRHERLSTLRWHFRRIYLPAFGAGLGKNDALKITPAEFRKFLTSTKPFLDERFKRRQARGAGDATDAKLFEGDMSDADH